MEIRKGCLLEALNRGEVSVILHQVNCQAKMNSGIAKTIREEYPKHYDDYMRVCDKYSNLLGNFVVTEVFSDHYIVGVFGQEFYGYQGIRYTNYFALLDGIRKVAEMNKGKTLALPYKLGCDRGGADWEFLVQCLEDMERVLSINFVAYKL